MCVTGRGETKAGVIPHVLNATDVGILALRLNLAEAALEVAAFAFVSSE